MNTRLLIQAVLIALNDILISTTACSESGQSIPELELQAWAMSGRWLKPKKVVQRLGDPAKMRSISVSVEPPVIPARRTMKSSFIVFLLN